MLFPSYLNYMICVFQFMFWIFEKSVRLNLFGHHLGSAAEPQLDIRSLWKQLLWQRHATIGFAFAMAMFWLQNLFYIIAHGTSHALWCNFKSGICAKSISELEYNRFYEKDFTSHVQRLFIRWWRHLHICGRGRSGKGVILILSSRRNIWKKGESQITSHKVK